MTVAVTSTRIGQRSTLSDDLRIALPPADLALTQDKESDPKYREISSLLLLEKVYRLVRGKGFSVGNVDLTVIAEEPRIQPHVEAIKANLARSLHLEADQIGIKATTMEGKGPIGRREGLAVQAVALLTKEK